MIRSIEPDENEVPARKEHPGTARAGWIEVIVGSMFSGKSEELIRRLRRAKIARQKIQVFKPEIDSRFSDNHIVSHSEIKHESANVRTSAEIRARVEANTEVVGIDEGQFFDHELIGVANELAEPERPVDDLLGAADRHRRLGHVLLEGWSAAVYGGVVEVGPEFADRVL